MPCAGLTAWNALTGGRPPVAGETALALGSGAVSLFALRFAKLHGMRVIATTSSVEKEHKLRDLGADQTIDYRATPDWHVRVRQLTGGRGVDHVIEVGGAATLGLSLQSVAVEGQISWVGFLAGGEPTLDANLLFRSLAHLRIVAVGSRAQFAAMNCAIAVADLKPVIDRVFAFDEAPLAFRYYADNRPFGKVVICWRLIGSPPQRPSNSAERLAHLRGQFGDAERLLQEPDRAASVGLSQRVVQLVVAGHEHDLQVRSRGDGALRQFGATCPSA